MILGLTHYVLPTQYNSQYRRNRYCSNSIAYLSPSQQDSIRSLIPKSSEGTRKLTKVAGSSPSVSVARYKFIYLFPLSALSLLSIVIRMHSPSFQHFTTIINSNFERIVRWQTGNGANFSLFWEREA